MKIKFLLNRSIYSLAIFSSLTAVAQNDNQIRPCYTYEAMEEAFAKDPDAKARYEKAQASMNAEFTEALAKRSLLNKSAAVPVYTIPVVFHILHQGGSENIADGDITYALDYMNKDYARNNWDANNTAAPFNSSYIDTEIRFMLAKKDPNGNCTTGIVRHVSDNTTWKQSGTLTNYTYTWDPTKYLNIYIVKEIVPTTTVTGGGIIVGYTYKPGTWSTGAAQDAIVYRFDFLTNNDNPRSLSHEVGHWLNLSHTWGDTNNPGISCGDDFCPDTPVTKGEFTACPTTSATACTQTNAAMNGLNNVQNIMNYSGCPLNFTTDQTVRMRTALASTTSGRSTLWSASNLSSTGADVNSTAACAPVSDFMSTALSEYTVCSGQTINTFKSFSYNGTITSYSWSATNSATIANPTSSITNITFPTVGTSTVSLTVSNGNGSNTSSRVVTIIDGAQTGVFGLESFEAASVPTGWTVRNYNSGSTTWTKNSFAGSEGTSSFRIDGALNPANHIDVLESPMFDLSTTASFSLTFKYAYRRQTATHADVFKVQMSDDCGATWKDVFAPSISSMASGSGGVSTANFVPVASEWKFQDVSSHPNFGTFASSKSVMARFYFQEGPTGFGNKLYLDEIGFMTPDVGINEITAHLNLNLYPNPTTGSANLNFTLSNDSKIKVSVLDVTGKAVVAEKAYSLNAGDHTITLNENNQLSKGIYIVNMNYNGTKLARKLIVE